ncbi:MAG TPA: DUF4337 domain-containing protein [Rhizomicrobium sp.]
MAEGMEVELKLESELGGAVAITVVIISVFLAIVHLKDENVIQGMNRAQIAAVDTWNQFEAERIKLHGDENDSAALKLNAASPGADKAAYAAEAQRLQTKIGKYEKQSDDLSTKAKAKEALYSTLEFRHDQFDMADAFCSIALALAAVGALAGRRWLLFGAWGAGAFGILMGLAGIVGWAIHPEWLASFLG